MADSFDAMITAIRCGDLVPALRVFKCDFRVANAMLLPMLETRGKFVKQSPSRYATLESAVVRGDPHRLPKFLDGDCIRIVGRVGSNVYWAQK